MHPRSFKAPWSTQLKITSAVVSLLLPMTLAVVFKESTLPMAVRISIGITGPLCVFICGLFAIRGYRMDGGTLVIQRLLWETPIDLDGLRSAERVDGKAMMRGAMKTLGNSGLFSYSGWWRNKALGNFRAWLTNWETLVLLEFPDRKVLISPEQPESFVEMLQTERRLKVTVRSQ